MSFKVKLEKRVREKEAEIRVLETALMEARAYLQATQDALRLMPKENTIRDAGGGFGIRAGTMLEQAFNILNECNKPMKVMDILEAMGKEQSKENRQSLGGSMGAYARRGHIFVRTGPNIFGLIEWKKQKQNSGEENEFPDDFGLR